MGFFYTQVEVDGRYPKLKDTLMSTTQDSHPHAQALCHTLEEVTERVMPHHRFWYKVHEDHITRDDTVAEYMIWHYEGIVYHGKYKLYIKRADFIR